MQIELKFMTSIHNSSLGVRRQKPIDALNSAGIGEGAKQKKFKNFS
jgi:hypothetical protein